LKLERWALIAEILSAVAVVVSLIFVGLQVRQGADETALNTKAIQTSAYQDLAAQISNLNVVLIENPELIELIERVRAGEELSSAVESRQVSSFVLNVFRHGEMAYIQYENGLIDEPSMVAMLSPVQFMLNVEYGREVWTATGGREGLNPRFISYVDELTADRASRR
jgi:hypothetical protein